jgi:hypothetical protein
MPSSSSQEHPEKGWQEINKPNYVALATAEALQRNDFSTERGIIRCSA